MRTHSALVAGLNRTLSEVRNRALEEAAERCERLGEENGDFGLLLAASIRALKSANYPGRWVGIGGGKKGET